MTESHPSFGAITVTRTTSGQGTSMFQSDLLHREYMTLRVSTAERKRDLNSDWVHPRQELLEVRMSLAQWGALVSSIGMGSGVPVTLVRRETGGQIESPPYEPRMKANLDEIDLAVEKLLEHAQGTLNALEEAIEEKKGMKAIREALSAHHYSMKNARANAKFAVDTLTEAAEKVVGQARADIESSILNVKRMTGTTPVEAPIVSPIPVIEE